MAIKFLLFVCLILLIDVNAYLEFEVPRQAFDMDLYKNVLDEELCKDQLGYIVANNSILMAQFLDAGIRTPRGILQGNFVDLGNYHECLAINANFEPLNIEGKYCMLNIPVAQDLELPLPEWPEEIPEFQWPELLPNTKQHRKMIRDIRSMQTQSKLHGQLIGIDTNVMRVSEENLLDGMSIKVALCLPKACTSKQAVDTLLINTTTVGFKFTEDYCRLKNDKPYTPGDYTAMAILSLIILITILSTCYDFYYSLLKRDSKKASTVGKSFSLYTNTRRLVTYNSVPGALECLDGIRAIAMMWVIVGHTYSTDMTAPFYNASELFTWITSFSSIWILAAPITVDTFFLLSGLLIVYTTVGKLSRMRLLKNLHLFYLNRLLRMFPVLATGVFLQATLFNHVSDGPQWNIVAAKVDRCRTYWWSTLTYLQIYLTDSWCIGPTWYLAVDVQLHILSPLVLFWILGKKRSAWIALTLVLLVTLAASTTYNYIMKFQPGPVMLTVSVEENLRYHRYYYINTLTRCTPFFIGMLFGYLLHIFKGKQIRIPVYIVSICWACSFFVSAAIIYSVHRTIQLDWDNQFLDGAINSFSRPAWAACVGWMIFACTHGYGGPINWFLSLRMWKLPARISFAMYIFHYPLMHIVSASAVAPGYFTVAAYFYRFLSNYVASFVVAFMVTLLVDSPFSTLIKLALRGGPKRPRQMKSGNKEINGENKEDGVDNPAFVSDLEKRESKTQF
ncbi:nose resistant to fluoxetine protein 6-like [Choristoneura fumiferana]|uniref:nose resistant to fluoxetine protein 6-like n=1 Tax=Choristoneura fumiferana TaxID=7141 RepID=UPI003D15AE26